MLTIVLPIESRGLGFLKLWTWVTPTENNILDQCGGLRIVLISLSCLVFDRTEDENLPSCLDLELEGTVSG
jgi:hypothetical protein